MSKKKVSEKTKWGSKHIYVGINDLDVWKEAEEYAKACNVSLSCLVAFVLNRFLEQEKRKAEVVASLQSNCVKLPLQSCF